MKTRPNVPAMIMFRTRPDKRRFIATLEANDTARRARPVFVK